MRDEFLIDFSFMGRKVKRDKSIFNKLASAVNLKTCATNNKLILKEKMGDDYMICLNNENPNRYSGFGGSL
jgi:hypothetical protein